MTGTPNAVADPSKLERTIVVAGNYRCGTTWLAEMLVGALAGYALAFEPLRAYLPSVKAAGLLSWRPYLTAESVTAPQREVMGRILDGSICRTDELPRTDGRSVLTARGVVVKFVRGLMSLRWLCDAFPIRHTFVIVRHPCGATASQFWRQAASGTPMKTSELAAFARHHPEIDISGIHEPEEWFALWWGASYYAALKTPEPHPWTLVRYEDLCRSADVIQEQVFEPLDESPRALEALRLAPSMTSGHWSTPGVARPWQDVLSPPQEERVLAVVARFGGAFRDLYEDVL